MASEYSSKMARAVVFGPRIYGGMCWESPYGILLYEQIKLVLGSLRVEDTVGKLLGLRHIGAITRTRKRDPIYTKVFVTNSTYKTSGQ